MKQTNHNVGESPRVRDLQRIAYVVTTLIALVWVGYLLHLTITQAFRPYVAETDWKQAVWQYWRYHIDGAFPPGNLVTDYVFVTHAPPFWWAPMALLSTFVTPTTAANILNIVAFLGACVSMYFVVRRVANHYVALVAAVFVPRMPIFFAISSGGYARSFGQFLILGFLALWLHGKRRWCLAWLILQAGLYPSAVIPCALAFGVWTLATSFRDRALRPLLELAGTGLVVITLGLVFDWRAPAWWGDMMTEAEAWANPGMRRGGRSAWVPMTDPWYLIKMTLTNPFRPNGPVPFPALTKWYSQSAEYLPMIGLVVAAAVYALVRRLKFPVQLLLLFGGAMAGYLLAREMAFQLYLPRRVLQHSYAVLMLASTAILFHVVLTSLLPRRGGLAHALSALLLLVPTVVFAGPGFREHTYRSYAKDAPLYEWLQKNTPLDATFAGNFQIMDEVPLFAQRQVYMNWKLAHPFRAGYWAEVQRRTLEMYRAYYATDFNQVLDFADREGVDYLIVDKLRYSKLERGDGQLFTPLREEVTKYFRAGRGRVVFEEPPPEIVAYRHRRYSVIPISTLRSYVAAQRLPEADEPAREATQP